MNVNEYVAVSRRPYSTLLQELSLFGRWFASRQLAFDMQAQTQSNWCWAATATSVSHFYWWFFNQWTQCRLANAELGLTGCCNNNVPVACNVPWYLDRALTRTNNFVSITAGPASFALVRAEIDAGRPVGARIGWSGGGGHFMVIYGYSLVASLEYLDIDDPIYGKSHLSLADFSTNYQGSGTWTHTYLTKSFFKMPIRYFELSDAILRRIREARSLLAVKQDRVSANEHSILATETQAALGMAQRVYNIGLDALLSKSGPVPQPVGLRVYETVGETMRAFFDVTEDPEPRVLQMSASKFHLEPFARGLAVALQLADHSGKDSELRLLRVPALNFDALWLHPADDNRDLLVPLHAVGQLAAYQSVPLQDALGTLREAARAQGTMDDRMGA